ncbi:MAG: T9SS type A sorting domain-containing protein, partial [Bacteroidetes bacterium]|nr:T9SS type A sorting domain-containing protein [Bacteroidota bacterium]
SLGVNAIELMPVNEFEGNSSWGYNPSFYFAPDKYYGPKDELKAFIDACHQRGMAVLIDMVLNHSYDQSPFVQLYFDGDKPTDQNPWYNREHNFTNPDAQWGNDFNHESLYTQALIDSINSYWMQVYKVDGFRFDFTKGFGNNIKGSNDPWGSNYDADRIALLKRMADEIWERNPHAIVILEHLAVNSEEEELADYGMLMWGNMNYNYGEAAMGYNESGKSNFSGISYKNRGWSNPHLIGYMESHDEERLMFKNVSYGNSSGFYDIQDTVRALERMGLVSSFFYTVPGPKMIWQFGELGYDYSIDYNGRLGEKPVRWDYYQNYYRKYLHDVVSSLLKLRKEHDVFRTTDFDLSVSGALKKMHLNGTEMNVCIVGNFDVITGSIDPDFQHTGWWYDYFRGDSVEVINVNAQLTLQPGEYRIYTDIRLETPQINTGIFTQDITEYDLINSLFPNPTSGEINMILNIPETGNYSFSIYDITGRRVFSESERTFSKGLNYLNTDLQDLENGLYFLQISSSDHTETVRIIKN